MSTNPVAPRQVGRHAWRGDELAGRDDWVWRLTDREVDELVAATAPFADGDEASLAALDREQVELPTLGPRLDALRGRLIEGLGFELVRGLPVTDIGAGHAAAAFVAIGCRLGSLRVQNAMGHRLGHVRNVGADADDPEVRIYQTDSRQTFHTDSSDVVALLCLETAQEGGDSLLAGVATIYNEILDRAPELAAVLFEPVATDRRGEVPPGADPWFTIPVLSWYAGHLTVQYQRQYIDSAQRFDEAPRLSDTQVAALDLFDEIAETPGIHLSMQLEVGDMQFVYNHGLLHDRTGFVDKPGSPRHLLRMWLSVPGDRELPPVFAERYGTITVGDRGGIFVGTD